MVSRTSIGTAALAIVAVTVAALAPAAALAQDSERARQLFEEGVAASEAQHWTEALRLFTESRQIVERASTVYNIAVALGRLGRVQEALVEVQHYLSIADPHDPGEGDRLRHARGLVGTLQGRLAHLTLVLSVADSTVEVDGRRHDGQGATRELVLDPGQHIIHVSGGGLSSQVEISLSEGQRESRDVTLGENSGSSSSGGLSDLSVIGIALAGVGVAAGVVALATGLVSNDLYLSLSDRCGPTKTQCPAGSEGDIDTGRALGLTSTVMVPVSLAALGVGVLLVVLGLSDGSGSADTQTARFDVSGGPDGVQAALTLAF